MMQPLRIGIVSDTYYPAYGGVTEHVDAQARHLRARGHHVKIITASYGANDAHFADPDTIRVGRALGIPYNGSLAHVAVGFHLSEELKHIFSDERFDILHIHNPLGLSLGPLALMAAQTKTVGTFHAYFHESRIYRLFHPFFTSLAEKLDARIAVSHAAEQAIARYFPGAYHIIGNGIETARFATAEALPEYADGRPTVLFVGRFDARKGLRHLLDAWPIIRKHVPNARLLAVGAGPRSAYYRTYQTLQQGGGDVIFAGSATPEQLPRFFASCDVFCSPAVSNESFGIVLLEAMAAGKPVVASDIAGYQEVVTNEKDGLLVPPRNPSAIADAIVRILGDTKLRERMSAAARKRAAQFDWATIIEKIEAVYEDVIGRRNA